MIMMKHKVIRLVLLMACCTSTIGFTQNSQEKNEDGWISLFNGNNLDGWKVGDNAKSFTIENGAIKVNGPVAHLFYMGEIGDHSFKNFEFKVSVMTKPGSNSGIYFHTQYQEGGWPDQGY